MWCYFHGLSHKMTGCFCLEMAIGPLAATQNKTLSLSHYQHCHGSQVDVSYCVNGVRADSCHNWAPFVFVVVIALLMVPVFIYFVQKFPNFCSQMCGLGSMSVRFMFTKFLWSVVQPTAHLSWISVMLHCYRQWMNKFSKMKVHCRTYNHCLFVSYLTSVAFGYRWISDTKFQKFSNKGWIWIFKKFIGYGSGVKKSISAHLCYAAHNKSNLKKNLFKLSFSC